MFRNNHVRLIGAGQKRYFKIHTFGSNSPPHPGKVKFPTPGQRKHSNARGLPGGGMLTFRIDRRITEHFRNRAKKKIELSRGNGS